MADCQKGWETYEAGDYASALREWKPLAKQGNANAQFNLGLMYRWGQGVTQDDAQAAAWYRKAAEQGNTNAQFNLALMYAEGRGVAQGYVQAHMWFKLAAAQGHEEAAEIRDKFAEVMTRDQIIEAQRLAREWTEKHPK